MGVSHEGLKGRPALVSAENAGVASRRGLRFRFGISDGHLQSSLSSGPSTMADPDLFGADGKDYSAVPTISVYRRSFAAGRYEAQLMTRLPQDLPAFLEISPVITTPHFP